MKELFNSSCRAVEQELDRRGKIVVAVDSKLLFGRRRCSRGGMEEWAAKLNEAREQSSCPSYSSPIHRNHSRVGSGTFVDVVEG